jgi:replicative DNA helicase
VKYLTNLNKEYQFYTELNNAMNQFRFKRETIKDFNSFVGELLLKLEPLQLDVKGEDPAIMGSISLTDETKMVGMFKELRERDTGTKIYRTGWQGINEMLQGGFRPGDTVIVAALPHQNKTGFTIALCKHLVVYNKPLNEDPNKKPLILRISFEDKLNDNLQSMYQNIYFNEHGCMPDLTASEEEMSQYIKAALSANGFYIEMIRVDPSQWTYKNIMSKVLEYETMGYVVEALMLDYLAMIPTTGCVQGPAGVDVRDLFRRMRNFCAARNTVLITPHQLSTDAKNLLRLGVSDELFVKELTGRGYFAGSKQLDQEADVILFIHRVENKKTGIWYQAVQLEKHRLPTVVSSDKKFLLLPFPKVGPIPDDLFRERIDIKRLAHASGIMAPEDFLD